MQSLIGSKQSLCEEYSIAPGEFKELMKFLPYLSQPASPALASLIRIYFLNIHTCTHLTVTRWKCIIYTIYIVTDMCPNIVWCYHNVSGHALLRYPGDFKHVLSFLRYR